MVFGKSSEEEAENGKSAGLTVDEGKIEDEYIVKEVIGLYQQLVVGRLQRLTVDNAYTKTAVEDQGVAENSQHSLSLKGERGRVIDHRCGGG